LPLPAPFLQSLEGVVGFNKAAFEAVHASGETVTAIRVNPNKHPDQILFEHTSSVPWCPHGHYLEERPSFTLDPMQVLIMCKKRVVCFCILSYLKLFLIHLKNWS